MGRDDLGVIRTAPDGLPRMAHKTYVSATVEVAPDGSASPASVRWPDGRVFPISEVLATGGPAPTRDGLMTTTYSVRVRGRRTVVYRESAPGAEAPDRWWVWAFD